jgi:hypothetical protein
MKDLVYILVGILIGGWLYSKFLVKKDQPLPDVSIYENRIDSLQKEIEKDKSKLTTYDSISKAQEGKIARLEGRLKNTAGRAAQEQKEHEEDLKRIRSMSNNDIAAAFTESFK